MPRKPKPGMNWLHNVEVRQEFIEALEAHVQNTGASRREAVEWALSHLPTYKGSVELPGWAAQIKERFIDQQQPFVLNYRDASDRAFERTVRYAEFAMHEQRTYLDFWADESELNQDIERLQHNWCVRLDRIISVEAAAIDGEWWNGLDTIEVEFHLFGGLSYAYAKESGGFKEGDIVSERVDANTRRVVRQISSTFWFIREVSAYLDDCRVVAPDSVRQRILGKLQKAIEQYLISL